ncbi:MAG: hypothetical protein IB618_03360 [Candidatus Pacearchaeota archaeon]|nr:MAG: hypothetical protein IB618_03360 [Candidatus Pacearchaeota archaeon]
MTGNEKSLDEIFGFFVGTPIRLDAEINGVHLKGLYVFAGNCKAGVKCIKVEIVDNRIRYAKSCTIIRSAEQVNSVTEIPPLLDYFKL